MKIALFFYFLNFFFAPNLTKNFSQKWIFYDRRGEILFSEKNFWQQNKIPNFLKKSLIAVEDQNFFSHRGVDFSAIFRAARQNFRAKKIVSGASTLSMQTAKILFLQNKKHDFWFKIQQIFFAILLEKKFSKNEILEKYLQRANFGSGAIGISAAAARYFSKNPENLSIGETATLISILPNPSKFNPILRPENAEIRKNLILKILAKKKIISAAEKNFWQNWRIKLRPQISGKIVAPHFIFWVRDEIFRKFSAEKKFLNSAEIHVFTTLDRKIYQKILQISAVEVARKSEKNNAKNSASVVIDLQKNEILSMLGSIDFFDEKNDGAVNMSTAARQTGSTLKPFLYAQFLENGFSPADEIRDEKTSFFLKNEENFRTKNLHKKNFSNKNFEQKIGGFSPRNFKYGAEYGRVRAREALANSYNISAVAVLQKIGVQNFWNLLQKLNLNLKKSAENLGFSAILGSAETSLLQLTNAFSVFPRRGILQNPQFFFEIKNEKNEKIFEWHDFQKNPTEKKVARKILKNENSIFLQKLKKILKKKLAKNFKKNIENTRKKMNKNFVQKKNFDQKNYSKKNAEKLENKNLKIGKNFAKKLNLFLEKKLAKKIIFAEKIFFWIAEKFGKKKNLTAENFKNEKKIFEKNSAEWVTDALSDAEIRWKNFSRGNPLELDFAAAAKTGTSQEFRDNWVVGFSPRFLVGVWAGNANGAPLFAVSGVAGAGPIWNKIMRLLHQNFPPQKFEFSGKRKKIEICRRPQKNENLKNCAEKIFEFLTPAEIEKLKIQKKIPENFEIFYPAAGDIFHENSQILIKTRRAPAAKISYFLDGKKIENPIEKIARGSHEIWAQSQNLRTEKILFFVQ